MSKNWSKEDRQHFSKSEVMTELEDIVLKTLKRADILLDKINKSADASQITNIGEQAKATTEEVKQLNNSLQQLNANMADDDEVDDDDAGLRNEVLDDLDSLKQAAVKEGNYKLAYRIERAMDEILEEPVACE